MNNIRLGKMVLAVSVFCLATAIASTAQTFTTLFRFDGVNGENPYGALVEGRDGNLYGTTYNGGANGWGTVFKITLDGQLTTLYNFCPQRNSGFCTDGALPMGALVQGANGNFYGTTSAGGDAGEGYCTVGCGTVFEITPSGKLTTLYNFCSQTGSAGCEDGQFPYAGLAWGANGNLFGGTIFGGGSSECGNGCGILFKITTSGGLTVLHSFDFADGAGPVAGLVLGSNGKLYGTTSYGGAFNGGTEFEITSEGNLSKLHDFSSSTGLDPRATLVPTLDGVLVGTTDEGGAHDFGTLFRITPTGSFSTIANFDGANGYYPNAVIQATDGNLYGTTVYGGENSGGGVCGQSRCGTIFELTASGALDILYSFCAQANCNDGDQAYAGLVQATNGEFYGTTYYGGGSNSECESGCGTIFSLSTGLAPFVETNPGFGKVGLQVGILGNNLTGTSAVSFNGTSAITFAVVSSSLIKATVPTGATTGTIQVTIPSGTLSSNVPFQLVP